MSTEPIDLDADDDTEEITITCTWESSNLVTVPKGWRPGSRLNDFPPGVAEQLTSDTAELIDWR